MRHGILALGLALGVVLHSALAVQAQDLAARLAGAPDGAVRLSFPTRPGVCGQGRSIGEETPDGFYMYTVWDGGYSIQTYDYWAPECRAGLLRLVVIKAGGRVTALRAGVGVDWLPDLTAPDLGTVSAPEAAAWLLDLAMTGDDGVARVAFLAANMADGARIAERLMAIARERDLRASVRQGAMRWMNTAAAREGRPPDADNVLKAIALDRTDGLALRERAVRELRATPANDAFLRELYRRLQARALKERIIRRVGQSPTGENAQWVRGLVLDAGEPIALRERAVRVLGEDLSRPGEVRELFPRLTEPALKERALRVVAERDAAGSAAWLRAVVEDGREPLRARDRALRLLAERDPAAMRELYDRLESAPLQDRAVRLAAEQGGEATVEWLQLLVPDRAQPAEVRDRAIRLLAEQGRVDFLRDAYGRLTETPLRDRILRLAGEFGGAEGTRWLGAIALDESEQRELRDRALRLLAERGMASAELGALYDRMGPRQLKQRVVRLLADRADDAAVEKLVAIARSDPDSEMRRYALRRLAETGHPKARAFLEEAVRRP